jgi:hypothetical protein
VRKRDIIAATILERDIDRALFPRTMLKNELKTAIDHLYSAIKLM